MKFNGIGNVLILLFSFSLFGCNFKSETSTANSSSIKDTNRLKIIKDSVNRMKSIYAEAEHSGSILPPTQAEEKTRISKQYDSISTIDSIFISNDDTLRLHLKYYCLKNSRLVVPRTYDSDQKNPKDFVTHEFVSAILLTDKKDTVLNREFKANDFYPFFQDNFGGNLKKYGSILMPALSRANKDSNKIVLDYSIAIPSTDIGIGMVLIISKNGIYKFVENY